MAKHCLLHPRAPQPTPLFEIAVRLLSGEGIALTVMVTANIYAELDLINETVYSSQGNVALSMQVWWNPLFYLQVWAWKRIIGTGPSKNISEQGSSAMPNVSEKE